MSDCLPLQPTRMRPSSNEGEDEELPSIERANTMMTVEGETVLTTSDIPHCDRLPTISLLDMLSKRFRRPWLASCISALKNNDTSARAYSYKYKGYTPPRPAEDDDLTFPFPEDADQLHESDDFDFDDQQNFRTESSGEEFGEPEQEGILVVYGAPRGRRSWEVQCLYQLSRIACKDYKLAIFFVSSDRTVAWWVSPNADYLAVCFVRGLGNRVKGVKGWGRASMCIEPDVLFRGYMELGDHSLIKCRISPVEELYNFGGQDSEPTIALLGLSVMASLVSLLVSVEGQRMNEDKTNFGPSGSIKALAGVLALVGKEYWPGCLHVVRTCTLGVVGGVTGLLVSNKEGQLLKFLKKVELPILIAIPFLTDNDWKVLIWFIALLIVPTYWSSIFRNRAGEGGFWALPLRRRKFHVADAVPRQTQRVDSESKFVGKRPLFTRRLDLTGAVQPAYARGFDTWDLFSWAVAHIPGESMQCFKFSMFLVLCFEIMLASLSAYIMTAGAGMAQFTGLLKVEESDGTGMALSPAEKLLGLSSGLLVSIALAKCWTFKWVWGLLIALVWVFLGCTIFAWFARGFAWGSYKCFKLREHWGDRTRQEMGLYNKSYTGNWRGLHKCRKYVQATFPRAKGYSYYDGELINVQSGWYYPACGRVAISVPRSKISRNAQSRKVEEFDTARHNNAVLVGIELDPPAPPSDAPDPSTADAIDIEQRTQRQETATEQDYGTMQDPSSSSTPERTRTIRGLGDDERNRAQTVLRIRPPSSVRHQSSTQGELS